MNDLYLRDRFENKSILYLFNKDIIEYDIKSAGINVSKEFELLPKEKIKYLESLPKQRRVVEEGKIKRDNPEYSQKQKEGLIECRRLFIESNELEQSEIISIRRDAIWTTRRCRFTEFGKHIRFVEKQQFSSFVRLGKRIEVFYSPMKTKVSGIDGDAIKKHESFMLNFINRWFQAMETEEKTIILRMLRRMADRYKALDLNVGYYRNFDSESRYVTKDGMKFDEYWDERKSELDIVSNYYNIIIRLIKITI